MEDITTSQRVERELALFKVSAAPGAARTEVVQLADMFRARIIDVSGDRQRQCTATRRQIMPGVPTIMQVCRQSLRRLIISAVQGIRPYATGAVMRQLVLERLQSGR